MGALGAAQAQKAVGQDAGFEKGIEVSFDEDATPKLMESRTRRRQ